MPLRKIDLVPGVCYHIFNRGIRKESIFRHEFDFKRFLEKCRYYKEKYAIEIMAWALMPNHFHFLLREKQQVQQQVRTSTTSPDLLSSGGPIGPISNFLLKVQQSHAMAVKAKYGKVGPVFKGRFESKAVLTDSYLFQLIHYIHRQPSHHGFGSDYDWPYSSLADYLAVSKAPQGTQAPSHLTDIDPNLVDIKNYPRLFKLFKEEMEGELEI